MMVITVSISQHKNMLGHFKCREMCSSTMYLVGMITNKINLPSQQTNKLNELI